MAWVPALAWELLHYHPMAKKKKKKKHEVHKPIFYLTFPSLKIQLCLFLKAQDCRARPLERALYSVLCAFGLADSHYFPKGRGPNAVLGGVWHLVFIRQRVKVQMLNLILR